MLEITNLSVKVESKLILQNLNLHINSGEIHIIMGPNGAGKSTLTNVLSGKSGYEIVSGQIEFRGQNLLEMEVEQRAIAGLFVAFQNPIEIPGVSLVNFLRSAQEARAKATKTSPFSTNEFLKQIKEKVEFLGLPKDFYRREVNSGLSGGQKKMSELLQLAVLEPKLAILDEIDSGLDIDATQLMAKNLQKLHNNRRAFLLITHYQKLLNFMTPDFVHILKNGRIVATGGMDLVKKVESYGYDQFD